MNIGQWRYSHDRMFLMTDVNQIITNNGHSRRGILYELARPINMVATHRFRKRRGYLTFWRSRLQFPHLLTAGCYNQTSQNISHSWIKSDNRLCPGTPSYQGRVDRVMEQKYRPGLDFARQAQRCIEPSEVAI